MRYVMRPSWGAELTDHNPDDLENLPTDEELEASRDSWWDNLNWQVSRVFTPAVPVSESDLFAGRLTQVNKVIDAINQTGQHAVVYGERGVGKTSLANVLSSRLVSKAGQQAIAPRVNCDGTDTFASLWRKVFDRIEVVESESAAGFNATPQKVPQPASGLLPFESEVTPDDVRSLLTRVGAHQLLLVILDEFDRLPTDRVRRAVADTIKTLSDHTVPATLVIVGVAETVGELIAEHESIERALIQVLMPRMKPEELHEILEKGTAKLGMQIEESAKTEIATLSQGLPNYTHRLALHATRAALVDRRLEIQKSDIRLAINEAVSNTQQSLQDEFRRAITSPQAGNLYERVLLACALANTDDFGYFAAADVRDPMSKIMGRKYDIQSFVKHLNQFCDDVRGRVLRKEGAERKYRYRFKSPLMQPFVVMKGIIAGHISEDEL